MRKVNILIVFLAIILAGVNAATPYFIGLAIDSEGRHLFIMVSAACLAILTAPLIKLIANIYISKANKKTRFTLKKKMISTYLTFLHKLDGGGHMISLVEGDVDGSLYLHHRIHFDLAFNTGLILLSICFIATLNPILTLPPLAAITLGLLICWCLKKSNHVTYKNYVYKDTLLLGRICDSVAQPSSKIKDYETALNAVERAAFFAHLRSSSSNTLSSSCYFLGISLLFYIGETLLDKNEISIGGLLSALIYIDRVLAPANALMAIHYSTREASVRLARIKSME